MVGGGVAVVAKSGAHATVGGAAAVAIVPRIKVRGKVSGIVIFAARPSRVPVPSIGTITYKTVASRRTVATSRVRRVCSQSRDGDLDLSACRCALRFMLPSQARGIVLRDMSSWVAGGFYA